ncbi:hypothetical protein [Streptomyces zaomyceticus]|uniref:hypothetical protein n=1 Tax=Streptomyces zaomyceticus TaxID=68286 RepID=UPI0036A650FB
MQSKMGMSVMDGESLNNPVTSWSVAKGDLPSHVLAAAESGRIFLLPDKEIDGVGIYRDDVAGLVKTLRHNGIDIDFSHARQDRRYLSEYGANEGIVAAIGLAIAANYAGDFVKVIARIAWNRARSALGANSTTEEIDSANVTVRVAEIVRNDQGTVIRGLEVTGQVQDLDNLLNDAFSERRTSELPSSGPDAADSEVPE